MDINNIWIGDNSGMLAKKRTYLVGNVCIQSHSELWNMMFYYVLYHSTSEFSIL